MQDMNDISEGLLQVLIQLGTKPDEVDHKLAHYIEHIVNLLPPSDDEIFLHSFGLFGHEVMPADKLAKENGLTVEQLLKRVEADVRRLAITPEWQKISGELFSDSKN